VLAIPRHHLRRNIMKPPTSPGGRNACLRYAVAALLELDTPEVPHFIEQPGSWILNVSRWAASRGLVCHYHSRGYQEPLPAGYFVAIIAPHTPGACHAVVMRGDEVVYDSSPYRRRYQKRGIGILELY
jgi:hypothetical protein